MLSALILLDSELLRQDRIEGFLFGDCHRGFHLHTPDLHLCREVLAELPNMPEWRGFLLPRPVPLRKVHANLVDRLDSAVHVDYPHAGDLVRGLLQGLVNASLSREPGLIDA